MPQGVGDVEKCADALAARAAGATLESAGKAAGGIKKQTVARYEENPDRPIVEASRALVTQKTQKIQASCFTIADLASGRAEEMIGAKNKDGTYKHEVRLWDLMGALKIATDAWAKLHESTGASQAQQVASAIMAATASGRALIVKMADVSFHLAAAEDAPELLPAMDAEVVSEGAEGE